MAGWKGQQDSRVVLRVDGLLRRGLRTRYNVALGLRPMWVKQLPGMNLTMSFTIWLRLPLGLTCRLMKG